MPNIVIFENQPVIAEGLALIIEGDSENKVLAKANSSKKFFQIIETHSSEINLAIIDIEIDEENLSGIEVAAKIRAKYPDINILFLTGYSKCSYILSVFGIYEGYLFKDVHPSELKRAIKEITTQGLGTYYPQDVIRFYHKCRADQLPSLKPEQVMTLNLVANGYSNQEIAQKLSMPEKALTEYSIRERRRRLRYLLDAKNSPNMIAKALKYGFISMKDIL